MLYGRYQGDHYGGGNPWVLSTGALADLFYRAALEVESGKKLSAEESKAWSAVLELGDDLSSEKFAAAATSAGDAVMTRLYHHVSDGGFHLAE